MNIQVIWENGVFRPAMPLNLKHQVMTIQVPDEEVIANPMEAVQPAYRLPPGADVYARAMQERLDRIRNAPWPDEAELPPLTQKQRDRMEAFALRDELKAGR